MTGTLAAVSDAATELSKVLYALSDPTRLKIVRLLHQTDREMRCGDFYDALEVTRPTLSHHFAVLRECGVIVTRVDGTAKFNSLARKEIQRRFPGLLDSVLRSLSTE
jgi:DNA-binding transcriptional ArsR family regulator